MKVRKRETRIRRALAGAAAVAVTGVVIAGVGSASAVPVTLKQSHTCDFPNIGLDPIKVAISVDLPTEIDADETVPPFDVSAITTVSANAADGIDLVNGKTIEGEAEAAVTIFRPGQQPFNATVGTTVEKTDVPSPPADFEVTATGSSPQLVFRYGGEGSIEVNSITLQNMVVRDSAGDPVALEGETVWGADCTLDAGEKKLLHTFTVNGDAPPPGAAAGGSSSSSGGDTGSTGGDTGSTGSSGGDAGSTGTTGGDTGSTGGDTGATGSTGSDTGSTGSTVGDTGTTGSTGDDTGGSTDGDTDSTGSNGTQLDTSVTSSDDDSLASTGLSTIGMLMATSGGMATLGIAAFHYLPRRIRGEGAI